MLETQVNSFHFLIINMCKHQSHKHGCNWLHTITHQLLFMLFTNISLYLMNFLRKIWFFFFPHRVAQNYHWLVHWWSIYTHYAFYQQHWSHRSTLQFCNYSVLCWYEWINFIQIIVHCYSALKIMFKFHFTVIKDDILNSIAR